MATGEAGARRRRRLSRSGEFERVYREGSSFANRHLVLYRFPRGEVGGEIRLGVSVGRKVGGAAQRNKVKRALREAFWSLGESFPPDHDFVIVARPELGDLVEREGTQGARGSIEEALSQSKKGSV